VFVCVLLLEMSAFLACVCVNVSLRFSFVRFVAGYLQYLVGQVRLDWLFE
jgi:hypothetical protein